MDNKIEVTIQNRSTLYKPVIEGEITWENERKGAPGVLSFHVVKDAKLSFQEGDRVTLRVNDVGVFYGFVFSKKRSKSNNISVTAYDQLRYLKNKDTCTYTNKTADELIKMIAEDFKLQCGDIEPTGYKIAGRVEDDKTLIDIILNALDATLSGSKKLYVLYDDFGKLALKNIESMRINDILINENAAEDFDYSTSIDGETYNQVKLYRDNQETGKRETYVAKDSSHINSWGLLQLYEKLEEKENGVSKADSMLSLYNRKTRELTVKKAFGDLRVRGGSSLPVSLNLGDMVARTYMVVDKVKHTITGSSHFMDLTFWGGFGK